MINQETIKSHIVTAIESMDDAKAILAVNLTEELTYGGDTTEIAEQVKEISKITGDMLHFIAGYGIAVEDVTGRSGFISADINGKTIIGRYDQKAPQKISIPEEIKTDTVVPAPPTPPAPPVPPTIEATKEPERIEAPKPPMMPELPKEGFVVEEKSPIIVPEGRESTVQSIDFADIFIEEKRKHADTFVFESYRINVSHYGVGRPEEMFVHITPLKIFKEATPGVPILVYVYYNGRSYWKSSYDNNKENGQLTVTMNIGDYEMLFRAAFDGNGVFKSYVNTTGLSLNQGDRIVVIDKKSYCPVGKQVCNGHIKFSYDAEDGAGVMEIVPLGIGEEEYMVMTIHGPEEFIDYYLISKNPGGIPTVMLTNNGVKSSIICSWDGDYLEADILPL